MYVVIWEFFVKPAQVAAFERHYAGDGTWAKLFRTDKAYRETLLLRDPKTERRYLTTDIWQDEASYHAFKQREEKRYQELDAEFEAFTESEALIGAFEVVE